MAMIVIGVDVHKHELTAVAVDELGRQLDALATGTDDNALLAWSKQLGARRLWAVEDCRHVSRRLERVLQERRERLVRVPPRLTAPLRRSGRSRGKSDLIDALAVARAALREPALDSPRPAEAPLRELKLLVDHRDDLVDERRRAQQRLRWHLHELDPALRVPLGALDRTVWLERLARRLAAASRRPRCGSPVSCSPAVAVSPARSSSSSASWRPAPTSWHRRYCASPAAARSAQPSCSARSVRSSASARTRNSPATPASHLWTRARASTNVTGSTAAATGNSTSPCTGSRSRRAECTHRRAPTWSASRERARAAARRSAASSASWPAP